MIVATGQSAPSPRWNLMDFHAFQGYEFTHKRGIQAHRVSILGVCLTHERGIMRVQSYVFQQFMLIPVSPVSDPIVNSL